MQCLYVDSVPNNLLWALRISASYTKYGSSFIVMTIIGGGIVTPVMGFVSDAAGNIPTAELIPALCFAVIFIFARFRSQTATN